VDYLVVVALGGIPYALMGAGQRTASSAVQSIGSVLIFVVFFAVFGATAAVWNGQTIGGRLLGLNIVKRSDGSAIGWVRALLRPIGVVLTAAFWFISLIVVLIGKEKRTPADALAGTVVIKRTAETATAMPPSTPPQETASDSVIEADAVS
jgi:uncharacterized RDD family membrane protein YckC